MNEDVAEDFRVKLYAMANSEKEQEKGNEKLVYLRLVLEALDSTMLHKDLRELLAATAERFNEIRPSQNLASTVSREIVETPSYFVAESDRIAFKKLDHNEIQAMLRHINFILTPNMQDR